MTRAMAVNTSTMPDQSDASGLTPPVKSVMVDVPGWETCVHAFPIRCNAVR